MNEKEKVERFWSCGKFLCDGRIWAMKLHYGDWFIKCQKCGWTGIALAREIEGKSLKGVKR